MRHRFQVVRIRAPWVRADMVSNKLSKRFAEFGFQGQAVRQELASSVEADPTIAPRIDHALPLPAPRRDLVGALFEHTKNCPVVLGLHCLPQLSPGPLLSTRAMRRAVLHSTTRRCELCPAPGTFAHVLFQRTASLRFAVKFPVAASPALCLVARPGVGALRLERLSALAALSLAQHTAKSAALVLAVVLGAERPSLSQLLAPLNRTLLGSRFRALVEGIAVLMPLVVVRLTQPPSNRTFSAASNAAGLAITHMRTVSVRLSSTASLFAAA